MRLVQHVTAAALSGALVLAAVPVAAQTGTITRSDIDRLEVAASDARADISNVRSHDPQTADRLQAQLDDLHDEVIYLKVRMRKEGSVPRSEFMNVRNRLDDLRSRIRSGRTSYNSSSPYERTNEGRVYDDNNRRSSGGTYESGRSTDTGTYEPRRSAPNEIPVGQELDVRLQSRLNSGSSRVEDRFDATTLVDLMQDERVLVPAGSVLHGVVSSVDPATRTDRKGSLTVAFDSMTVNGRDYPIRATVTEALESEGIKGEVAKIGAGAGVGAIIGGILGGVKGALAGILIGGGGTIAATTGKDVDLPVGTVLRVRFESPVVVR